MGISTTRGVEGIRGDNGWLERARRWRRTTSRSTAASLAAAARDGHPRGPARGGRGRRRRRSTWSPSPAPAPPGDRGVLPDALRRAARCAASRTARWPGRARRARLPLDDRAQRRRRAAHRRAGRRARRRPARGPGRAERGPPAGRQRRRRPAVPSGPVVDPRRGRDRDRRRRLRDLRRRARCSPPVPGLGRGAARLPRRLRGRRGLATPAAATPSWSVPAGSSTASAPTTSAPPPRSRRATTTATAPRWPRSPPATPGCRCASTTSGSAATAAWRRRPGWRSTRRAGWRPTPPATAARPPTS